MAVVQAVSGGKCPKCGGTGYVRVLKRYPDDHYWYPGETFEAEAPCECRIRENLRRAAGLSAGFEQRTFENFSVVGVHEVVRLAHRKAKAYVAHWDHWGAQGGGLLLMGASGSGKTHLLCAVVNALVDRLVRVVYLPYVEAIAEFRMHRFDDEWLAERKRRLKECELLVIDDLWKVEPDRFAFEILFEIVNHRYFEGRAIAASTEWTPEELLEYDAAIAGRLLERAKGYAVVLKAEDDRTLNFRLR